MPAPSVNFQSRPNKHADRIHWNESWERELKKSNYASSRRVISYTPGSDDSADVAISEVCQLQHDLCEYAVRHITDDDFAVQWKTLPQTRREELVLDALFQASCAEPNVENYRQWCPEMTMAYLASNDGRGLLSLLLGILPEDLEETFVEPIVVDHAGVDQLLKNKKFRASATRYRKHRTYFISMVLFYVILAFYEEEAEYSALTRRQSSSGISSKDEIPLSDEDPAVQITVELMRPQSQSLPADHETEASSDADRPQQKGEVHETLSQKEDAETLQQEVEVHGSSQQKMETHKMPEQEEESSQPSTTASSTVVGSSVGHISQGETKTEGRASSHDPSAEAPRELLEPREQPSANEAALNAKCVELSNHCWKCEKLAAQLLPSQDLKMCGKCAAIGRTIRYCSRECQVDDWKKGSDLHCAHKWICGKLLSDDFPHQVLSKKKVVVKVPAPDPGFNRSRALLHLISFLEQPQMIDYVFICPPDVEKLVMIPPFTGLGADRNMFLSMRQRALKNGDPASVKKMFQLLRPWAELLGYPDSKLKKQLRDEYNVDVDQVSAQPAAVSSIEMSAVSKLSAATRSLT